MQVLKLISHTNDGSGCIQVVQSCLGFLNWCVIPSLKISITYSKITSVVDRSGLLGNWWVEEVSGHEDDESGHEDDEEHEEEDENREYLHHQPSVRRHRLEIS